ncbi:MAG: hypothetical protein RBT11_11945 [Desulfobacterales bacterium]|jgi:hypothetical protein|nr:hypothetical protein [Desulfobacterales bacterium]
MKFGKVYLGLIVMMVGMVSCFSAAVASDEKPTCDMSLTVYSQYIWRGYALSKDSIVLFPQTTVSYKGFGFDMWADLDTDYYGNTIDNGSELNETDLTLFYGNSIGILSYSLGWIYYDFDGGEDQEVYATFGVDVPLSPAISIYRGIEHSADTWYFKFALSHSFELKNSWSIDVGGWVGYYDIQDGALDGGDYSEFHDATLWAGLNIPITDWCTVTPSINYSFPLSGESEDLIEAVSFGNDSNFFYGGVKLAISF